MYLFRQVLNSDLELVCRHRHEMFKASGRSDAMVQPMTDAFRPWLARKLSNGDYFGWIAICDGNAVAGIGMMEIDWPPHPSHPTQDRRGYILNVFVEPEHRGRGVAKKLMALAMEEGKRRGIEYYVLHATKMARPLYEKLGWGQTAEMGLTLK